MSATLPCGFFVIGFGFDYGDGEVAAVAEEVIGAFGFAAFGAVAADDDPAFGEATLFRDGVRLGFPAG